MSKGGNQLQSGNINQNVEAKVDIKTMAPESKDSQDIQVSMTKKHSKRKQDLDRLKTSFDEFKNKFKLNTLYFMMFTFLTWGFSTAYNQTVLLMLPTETTYRIAALWLLVLFWMLLFGLIFCCFYCGLCCFSKRFHCCSCCQI